MRRSTSRAAAPRGLPPGPRAKRVWEVLGPGGTANRRRALGRGDGAPRDAKLARLEAVLFLARESLSSRKLAQWSGLADGTEARTLVRLLNQYYARRGTAFRVEEVASGYQLLTRPALGRWLRRQRSEREIRLSPPALETLAVVAYLQPVLRAEIESIRGVQCGEILRQLMERGLVRLVDRADELGRPYRYGTTRQFLQLFGLRRLDELPRAEELRRKTSDGANDAPIPHPNHLVGEQDSP